MKFLTKSLLSAGAAAAALVSAAAPAEARYRDNDRISAGEVIAGAVILGGLAAVIASADDDRDYRYSDRNYRYDDGYNYHRGRDRDRWDYDYNRYGNGRQAVNQCISTVESWASRYSRSDVTEIRDIDRTRYGYKISGNVVVRDGWRGRDRYDRGYDRGYERGYDRGRFTCYVEQGRVVDVNYSGLDRWR
jgi:hypothetical protein